MNGKTCWVLVLAFPMLAAGLPGARADEKDKEATIKASLAQLSAKDRKLAEGQKYCPIETKNRLGELGKPVKVIVKGQPVFLCCNDCKKAALAHPDKTLATVKKLKAKAVKEDKR